MAPAIADTIKYSGMYLTEHNRVAFLQVCISKSNARDDRPRYKCCVCLFVSNLLMADARLYGGGINEQRCILLERRLSLCYFLSLACGRWYVSFRKGCAGWGLCVRAFFLRRIAPLERSDCAYDIKSLHQSAPCVACEVPPTAAAIYGPTFELNTPICSEENALFPSDTLKTTYPRNAVFLSFITWTRSKYVC